ncbi:hypothetical protein ECDEC4C_4910 [Escherichia coli DEC4C]|nr:hypothetical protein ECDEC4C_4910 [Escherichia coli DEC4C]
MDDLNIFTLFYIYNCFEYILPELCGLHIYMQYSSLCIDNYTVVI